LVPRAFSTLVDGRFFTPDKTTCERLHTLVQFFGPKIVQRNNGAQNQFFLFFSSWRFDMAIADQSTHTIQPTQTITPAHTIRPTHTNIKALRGLGLLGFFAAIAIAAALVYFIPGGLEVTQLDPSQLVAP
jgi:hypothetical protein